MLIKLESIKNNSIKRFLGHIVYLTIAFCLVPCFFYFELCIVLPAVAELWSLEHLIHLCSAMFLLHNIIGNMICGMFTDSSIRGRSLCRDNKDDWTFCSVCECLRPPRAWHCNICNICILKRDHHCTFFASCVGYYNHRYFMFFTFYVFLAMAYAFCYNVKFVSQFIEWNRGLVIVKFIFPLASFVVDFGDESIYVFILMVNVIVGLFSGFLFIYHFKNILIGCLCAEAKSSEKNPKHFDRGMKMNLREVFGLRWHLTWISPFIHSQLPGNGIDWYVENKHK